MRSQQAPVSRFSADTLQRVARVEAIVTVRRFAYSALQVEDAQSLLDIGCGPGTTTIELAEACPRLSRVVGVDCDEAMIAEADRQTNARGLSPRVDHRVADARALPFPDESFDRVYCERVLQHLHPQDVNFVLAEAWRVLVPNGKLCLVDTDWTTLSIDAEPFAVERLLVALHAQRHRNPSAGRQLARLLVEQGFSGMERRLIVNSPSAERLKALLSVPARTAIEKGRLSSPDASDFFANIDRAVADGGYCSALVTGVAVGAKSQQASG